jgi:hypothetical protein
MLLERFWLKQVKINHNWGDNTFTIIAGKIIMTMNTIKKIALKP